MREKKPKKTKADMFLVRSFTAAPLRLRGLALPHAPTRSPSREIPWDGSLRQGQDTSILQHTTRNLAVQKRRTFTEEMGGDEHNYIYLLAVQTQVPFNTKRQEGSYIGTPDGAFTATGLFNRWN